MNITAIILTKDERRHIGRCLERLQGVAERVIVVDSMSSDETQDIARQHGAEVIEHEWPGNQAAQFNWALDNLNISTDWILRLDADEYLTPELINELNQTLPNLSTDVSAICIPRGRAFQGKRLKHGIVNTVDIVRIFRRGRARYEERIMDEHLEILSGEVIKVNNKFIDDNLMPISEFIIKHINYANREAQILFEAEQIDFSESNDSKLGQEVARRRKRKNKYNRMPLYWRAFAYFVYRYIFRLGFLDGREGFLWDFMQGWWYRTLVDARLEEMRKENQDTKI